MEPEIPPPTMMQSTDATDATDPTSSADVDRRRDEVRNCDWNLPFMGVWKACVVATVKLAKAKRLN